jgi:sarcosine oxidase
MTRFDAIVLGLGGMGSAALHHLAKRGARVLGLERFELGHARGSSHGETRLIRRAYFEHPSYVPLLDRSYALWSELEAESGARLFERVGLVLVGEPDHPVMRGVELTRATHSLAIERVDGAELARWPLFRTSDREIALFEGDAGFLHVEACVLAHLEAAKRHGAAMRGGEIAAWKANPSSIEVHTPGETFEAAALVVCAGAWSNAALDLGLPLEVRRRVQLWFETADPRYSTSPAFAFAEPHGFFYGFPSLDRRTVKVAEHGGDEVAVDPDALDRRLHDADVERVASVVGRRLAGVAPRPSRHAVCMYTMSPDEHFVVGKHERWPHVVYGAGFSGHGFKFAPVIGSVLADLALDGQTREPVALFSPDRPAVAMRRAR